MKPYQINMQFLTGNNNLRELYCLDGIVLGFYIGKDDTKDFERYYPQYKDCHCVYILLDNTNPEEVSRVYIGKSNSIKSRYTSHSSEDWWQVELAFTGRDLRNDGLKEDYDSFLEYYMCYQALQNGQNLPYNSHHPQEPPIDIVKKQNLENKYFLEINELTQAIGFPIFLNNQNVSDSATTSKSLMFHCTSCGANARATYDNNRIIVEKGSKIALKPYKKFPHKDILRYLEHNKVVVNNIFKIDYPFNSPTEAGNIVSKSTINGRICWKTNDGKTISDVFDN